MTSQVIRADLIKREVAAARQHLGGFMAYYRIFLEALWHSERCLVSQFKEVHANDDNTGGYSFYKVWAVSVFDVFLSSSFAANRRILTIMKRRMFLALLLPITFKLRTGVEGFHFLADSPQASMNKYFGSFSYRTLFGMYLSAPEPLLRVLHRIVAFGSSAYKRTIRGIA